MLKTAIARILDWVNPDRIVARAKDERQELFRQHIEAVCNLADSNEKIARAFFTLVERQAWSMERMGEAVTLLPSDRYEEVNRLLIYMLIEADIKVIEN